MKITIKGDNLRVSDGYHTIQELYEHRFILFIALARTKIQNDAKTSVWRARCHSDGTSYDGWFILGIGKEPGEQITYHLPGRFWGDCFWAEILERAPEFDGHTSADVLERLGSL